MSTGRLTGVAFSLLSGLAFAISLVELSSASGAAAAERVPSVARQIGDVADRELPIVILKGHPQQYGRLSDLMRRDHVPAISVAVIHDGAIEWAKGFGVTRIGGPPVTSDTLFEAGSISKPVTALEVLRLVQAGRLALDADVNGYLKTWRIPANSFTQRKAVTLRELLSHTAGVTVHGFGGYEAGQPLPTLPEVLNGTSPANSPPIRVDQVPGTAWRYSGGGYVITEQLLEDVTGQPFAKLMHDGVLEPLGMSHSTFDQPLPDALRSDVALPYHADGTPIAGGPHVYPEQSAAGLWTTPSDLARFALSISEDLRRGSQGIISGAMARVMVTPVLEHYGLGLEICGITSRPCFSHGGVDAGYESFMISYDDGRDGAVVMTDGEGGMRLAMSVIRTLAHDLSWPDWAPAVRQVVPLNATAFDRFAGAYKMQDGPVVTFWREGRHVYLRLLGQRAGEIFPMSDREYTAEDVDARVLFRAGVSGTKPTLTIYQTFTQHHGTLLPGSLGKAYVDKSRADQVRFGRQAPDRRSAAAVRRLLLGLAAGRPDYSDMEAPMVNATRRYLPNLKKTMLRLGTLKGMTFKRVTAAGDDIYDVRFSNGAIRVAIGLSPDGKVADAGIQPP
ncbi:MAG TPA: serine hydrolase domain-containing protein [Steroidobacteraceae bacterium]|nr:serine hydrolase domain-containing protein [Steroidobacteraceae bacterium]